MMPEVGRLVGSTHSFLGQPGDAARSAAEHEWPDQSVGAGPRHHVFVAEPQDGTGGAVLLDF